MPIERVRAGDLVLSRDERTGEQIYKPVLDTFETRADALYTVTYDRDGAGPIPAERVQTTAPHPFYVGNRDGDGDGLPGGFVAASDLRAGDALALADGSAAAVVGLTVERAGQGEAFTTYNFEVADFHTYFVNADGVWVHNSASTICEKAFSVYRQYRAYGRTPEEAFAKANQLISSYVTRGTVPQNAVVTHLGDALDEVFKKDVWPTQGEFWSPGPANLGGIGGRNAYSHFVQHVVNNKSGIPGGEFPGITDAVTYVKSARAFLDGADPDAISWTVGTNRHVFHKTKNWFSVEDISSGSPGKVRTFFQSNLKVKVSGVEVVNKDAWVRQRGYSGPAI